MNSSDKNVNSDENIGVVTPTVKPKTEENEEEYLGILNPPDEIKVTEDKEFYRFLKSLVFSLKS